ncbi:hypothetical protein [Azospirillum argentinense]|uniref:Uncharacterized protein n=1 Tax=Azospirillum brasilense TaxID=192 RepID=A0A4D8QET3_AZOBR|nr:hypothetical protein [Azospirillum argentinense]QCO05469.1 hypothetical protein D3867_26355 [Azospirillum argentinense]
MRWHDAPPIVSTVDGDQIAKWSLRFCGVLHAPTDFEVYAIELKADGVWRALPEFHLTEQLYSSLVRLGIAAETYVKPRFRVPAVSRPLIEHSIPAPAPVRGSVRKYPFDDMKIGDSFFVAGFTSCQFGGRVTMAKLRKGFRFRMRTEAGGVRIWRIA